MKIFDLGYEEKGFSIGIGINDKNNELGDLRKLDKYLNINYEGLKTAIDDNGKRYTFHQIHFTEGDNTLKEYILDTLNNEQSQNEFHTFVDLIEYISMIFRNYIKDKTINRLLGDIGEVLFILHLEKNNIDWKGKYHVSNNSLFDFSFDNYCVDIKTTSQNKKTIKISLQQLIFNKPKKFVIVQVNKVCNKLNIIQLIDKIKNHHDLIDEMRKYWYSVSQNDDKFVNSYTADENDEIFILDDNKIPILSIINEGDLKNAIFEISTTNNSKNYLDKKILKTIVK